MHDRKGTPIRLGDVVKVEFIVTGLHGDNEFCNVNLESVYPMPGNGSYTFESAINTKQVEVVDPTNEPWPIGEDHRPVRPIEQTKAEDSGTVPDPS